MTDMHTEQDQRRSYFEQTLLGKDYEIEAATEAAMDAVARGEGRAAIIAAGRAAATQRRIKRGVATVLPRLIRGTPCQ